MKKIALLSLAVLLLAACSKEEDGRIADGQQMLSLTGSIESMTDDNVPAARSGMQSTQIVENETVWAWISDGSEKDAAYYIKILTTRAGGVLSGSEPIYFPQKSGKVDIRALHGKLKEKPKVAFGTTKFAEKFVFSVSTDQRAGGGAYVQSDLLYAAADGVACEGNSTTVPLTFYHMLGKLELVIEKASDISEDITGIAIEDMIVEGTFKPVAGADLTQQSEREKMIVADGSTGKMLFGTELDADGTTNDVIVIPQSLTGKKLTINLSGGDKQYALSYPFSVDSKVESGKRLVCKVELKGQSLSVSSSVKPWDDTEEEKMMDATNSLPQSAENN